MEENSHAEIFEIERTGDKNKVSLDAQGLGPRPAGRFTVGFVDFIAGQSGLEVPGFVATKHEIAAVDMSRVGATIQVAKFHFNRAVRRLLPMRWRLVGKRGPVSMILLLRKVQTLSEEDVRHAAESAWGLSFSSFEASVRRIAKTDDGFSIQAGVHVLSICNYPKSYVEKPEEGLDWLPQLSQQRAWADHTACCWINYWTAASDLELAHCVLAKVVLGLLNDNCTGVYIPSEDSLIPAKEAAEDLQRMSSYRFSGLIPDK